MTVIELIRHLAAHPNPNAHVVIRHDESVVDEAPNVEFFDVCGTLAYPSRPDVDDEGENALIKKVLRGPVPTGGVIAVVARL